MVFPGILSLAIPLLWTSTSQADPVEFLNGRLAKHDYPTFTEVESGIAKDRYAGKDWTCLTHTSFAGLPYCTHPTVLEGIEATHTLLFCDDAGEELCLEVFESRTFAVKTHLTSAAKSWMSTLQLGDAQWQRGKDPAGDPIAFQAHDQQEVVLAVQPDTLTISSGKDAYFLVFRITRRKQERVKRIIEQEKERLAAEDAAFFGEAALSAGTNIHASCLDTCDIDICFGEEYYLLESLNEVLTRRFTTAVSRYLGNDGSFSGKVNGVRVRGTIRTAEGQAARTAAHESYVSAYHSLAADMAETPAYQCWMAENGREGEHVLDAVNRMVDAYNDWNRLRENE